LIDFHGHLYELKTLSSDSSASRKMVIIIIMANDGQKTQNPKSGIYAFLETLCAYSFCL
jgi:hypothetical protein